MMRMCPQVFGRLAIVYGDDALNGATQPCGAAQDADHYVNNIASSKKLGGRDALAHQRSAAAPEG